MKTKFTVHGIYKCQLEFINCTGTDKKIRKKKKSKSSIVYIVKERKKKQPTENHKTK